MTSLKFTILDENLTLHRLLPSESIPEEIFTSSFYSITKTSDELSIVCPEKISIKNSKKEMHWSCIKLIGPLPFEMTGVLAKISSCLAEAEISIFAISSYDTDYVLVKKSKLEKAVNSLSNAGFTYITI